MELAERDGTVEEWLTALDTAARSLADPGLTRVLANPALPFTGRQDVAEQVLGDRVTGFPRNLVLLLVERGRIELLPAVAREFKRLRDQREGIVEAQVTSATPLSDEDIAALRDRIADMTGGRAELAVQVDPALLGGVTIRLGDRLIDGSVRGRLERLRSRLASGAL
jgi:F-type H+-transporting ATPase subunit delta